MSDTQKITIICSRPGMRRAGMAHPAKASYASGHFTDDQLAVLKNDPNFQVLEGEPETAAAFDLEASLTDALTEIGTLEAKLADKAAAEETAIKAKEQAVSEIAALKDLVTSKDAEIAELKADAAKSANEMKSLEAKLKKFETASRDAKK